MDFVTFNRLHVIRRNARAAATSSPISGTSTSLGLRCVSPRLSSFALTICVKDCVRQGRGILLKKVQIHAPAIHMLMGCPRHGLRTRGLSGGRRLRLRQLG